MRYLGAVPILVLLFALTPGPNLLANLTSSGPDVRAADAIVVLSAGLNPDGSLNRVSMQRTIHGLLFYRMGLAPLLVFSGSARLQTASEAAVRAQLARDLGVPGPAILTDSAARTTYEEAVVFKEVLRARGVARILLVTDPQHMTRASAVFRKAGFLVYPAPTVGDAGSAPEDRLWLLHRVTRELAATIYYRAMGYL